MDIRAHPISFSERPREAGRATRSRMRRRDRFSISSFQLADLGGKANYCYRDQLQTWGGGHPLSGCCLRDARLIAALLCQHGPSDPRQLVGEGSGQNVRMQALSGANEPESEAVLRPVRRPQQNDPGCLHEECSQVTVAALGDAPGMVRSPVDICLGTRPSQAEKSRPLANAAPLPIAATIALEMIGPMPGTVITLRQLSSLFANASISSVTVSIRSSSRRQSPASSVTIRTMRGERTSACLARMSGSNWRRKRSPCRTMTPRSRRKPRI